MDAETVAARYARFARDEAPGRCEQYARWAVGVASDPAAQRVLERIPPAHRQPPLVFAVTRLLGVAGDADAVDPVPYAAWRDGLLTHAEVVVAECTTRSLQTNEPQRCAALLPALSGILGPLALLEIGASAGLCLYPDRYSYRYRGPAGAAELDPVDGPSDVVLECELRGQRMPPLALPEIVWRAGIDLAPLEAADPATDRWLTTLVWPGESGRADRVRAALRIAAADPPALFAGDGAALLAEVAASAPADATLVIQTPGVLAHLAWPARHELIAAVRRARDGRARWLTLDAPTLHEGWHRRPAARGGGFALGLDGDILAAADPLGAWLEWRTPNASSAA
ncbi:MAG: DUF2332 domain-containing protein [Microbacterium sp.]